MGPRGFTWRGGGGGGGAGGGESSKLNFGNFQAVISAIREKKPLPKRTTGCPVVTTRSSAGTTRSSVVITRSSAGTTRSSVVTTTNKEG